MSFDRQPTLCGETITLRPLRVDDWAELYAVAADPLIWAGHPMNTRYQEPVFRAYFDDALAAGGTLVVTDKASGAIIGASRYDFGRAEAGEVEIGWTFLARSHWGGATNAEMKALMLAHAFGNVERVIFLIGETNIRSRRAMEKIGGVLTDRIFDMVVNGATIRHVIYAINRPDGAMEQAGVVEG